MTWLKGRVPGHWVRPLWHSYWKLIHLEPCMSPVLEQLLTCVTYVPRVVMVPYALLGVQSHRLWSKYSQEERNCFDPS
jgi:hypothetical protein